MIQEDKANLIDDIRGKEYEEIRRYLDTGTKYDLREVWPPLKHSTADAEMVNLLTYKRVQI